MKNALKTAGAIFLIVAILHVLRYFLKVPVTVGASEILFGWSLLAAGVMAGLACWMFYAAR